MKHIVWVIVILVMASSCKKDEPSYWYKGMQIIDTNGNLSRWVGQEDDDWTTNKYTISAQQLYAMPLDSLSDTASWNHTAPGNVAVNPGTNPVAWDSGTVNYYFSLFFNTNAYFSYVVTDKNYTVLASHGYYGNAGNIMTITVPIPSSSVDPGDVCRIYYSFSARGNTFFAQGWGDIGVCSKDTITHSISNCF